MTRRPQKSRSRSLPSRKTRKPAKAAKPVRRAKPAQRRKPAQRAASPLDDFILSGASALGLTIDKAWMPAVRSHLEVTLRHGASVTAFTLPDEVEPAPVFKA
jgi:hypothetical protein